MANSIVLIKDALAIERIAGSPYWRMRWKSESGWSAKSTKKTDEKEAEIFARSEYASQQILAQHGLNVTSVTVSKVSKIVYENMIARNERGDGKSTYRSYMSIIRNFLDPIAGDWSIKEITNSKIEEYDNEVARRMGHLPAKGTYNHHNIVWRMIFDLARDKKWCSADDVPKLTVKDKGRKSERRPDLSLDEYKILRRFMRTYHESADRYDSRYKRLVLREYIIFLIASGMRPGKELLSLKWRDIEMSDGAEPALIKLQTGKTNGRPIVPMNFIKPSLRRLKEVTGKSAPNDYLFCMQDGSQFKDVSGLVIRLLADAGLRTGADGKRRSAYSVRHTYATFLRVYRNFSYDDLAENMGNSALMVERYYSHAKPQDRSYRFATGKAKRTTTDRRIDRLYDTLVAKFPADAVDAQMKALPHINDDTDALWDMAIRIEIAKWDAEATKESETATGANLKYIFEAAQNRVSEFLNGDTIW